MKMWIIAVAAFFVTQSTYAKKGPFDGLPVPFEETNKKAELADGEVYALVGSLRFNLRYKMMEFYPSFEAQPWLASDVRKDLGFYPLQRYSENWFSVIGKSVLIEFRAHGKIYQNDNLLSSVIELDPLSSPVEVDLDKYIPRDKKK